MTSLRRLEELRADVHHHRERRDHYRSKMHRLQATSPAQISESEGACVLAEARLRRAEQEHEAEAIRLRARPE
jgi:hypothetical protein